MPHSYIGWPFTCSITRKNNRLYTLNDKKVCVLLYICILHVHASSKSKHLGTTRLETNPLLVRLVRADKYTNLCTLQSTDEILRCNTQVITSSYKHSYNIRCFILSCLYLSKQKVKKLHHCNVTYKRYKTSDALYILYVFFCKVNILHYVSIV